MLSRRGWLEILIKALIKALIVYSTIIASVVIHGVFQVAFVWVRHVTSTLLDLAGPTEIDKLSVEGLDVISAIAIVIIIGYFVFVDSKEFIERLSAMDYRSSSQNPPTVKPITLQIDREADKAYRLSGEQEPNATAIGADYQPLFFKVYKPTRKAA